MTFDGTCHQPSKGTVLTRRFLASLAALTVALGGSIAATPASADPAPAVPIVAPAEPSGSLGTPPAPTAQDKPYKATTRDKAGVKGNNSPGAMKTLATCPCFQYVWARQQMAAGTSADGLAANLPVENAYKHPSDYHNLAQLHVKSLGDEAIEFGVTRDSTVFADTQPRIFAGYRKNGVWQGYGTGFVDYAANTSVTYGTAVPVVPGTQRRFEIKYSGGAWWLAYDMQWIGYFPGSLFPAPDTFTNGYLFQAFLEVAHANPSVQTCTDLGNGLPASSGTAARLGSINLSGLVPSTTPVSFNASVEPAGSLGYSLSYQGGNTWRAGGPGANAALTGVGTTGSC